MSNNVQRGARKTWVKPVLLRMDAGSAENNNAGPRADSNPSGNKRS